MLIRSKGKKEKRTKALANFVGLSLSSVSSTWMMRLLPRRLESVLVRVRVLRVDTAESRLFAVTVSELRGADRYDTIEFLAGS